MSNKQSDPNDEQADAADAADEAPAAESETATGDIPAAGPAAAESAGDSGPAAATARPRRGSGSLAWLALFLAFIALAATGYSLVRDWRAARATAAAEDTLADTVAGLSAELATASDSLRAQAERLDDLAGANEITDARVDELSASLERRIDLLDSLPPRMASLENTLAALQGVSKGARDTWLLAEAEYYMQIANAQLQLASNPQLAAMALAMADERIVQLADPALTGVRRALANELAALELMAKPDVEGISLTLASLARVVDSLPLQRPGSGDSDTPESSGEPLSRLDRAWNSVRNSMANMIKIRKPDQDAKALVAPDAEQFLRANLALQLQTARLALLRGEQAVFEQSLDDAAAWIVDYFDSRSTQVSSVLDTLAEIRDGTVTVAAPDISESLRLLRRYRTLAETEQ